MKRYLGTLEYDHFRYLRRPRYPSDLPLIILFSNIIPLLDVCYKTKDEQPCCADRASLIQVIKILFNHYYTAETGRLHSSLKSADFAVPTGSSGISVPEILEYAPARD